MHFHVVVADGVLPLAALALAFGSLLGECTRSARAAEFVLDDAQQLAFVELAPPSDQDVENLVLSVSRRVDRWIAAHLTDTDDVEQDDDEHGLRAHAIAEAQPPRRPRWLVDSEQPIVPPKPRCANYDGYTVHVQTAVEAEDRRGLEHLLRYCLRGSLAIERLSMIDLADRILGPRPAAVCALHPIAVSAVRPSRTLQPIASWL